MVVVWAGFAAGKAIAARHDLLLGRAHAEAARGQTSAAEIEAATPVAELRLASAKFHAGKHLLDAPLLFPARFLPVAGRQLQSARALAGAGATAADTSIVAVNDVHQALATGTGVGAARLTRLNQLLAIASTADHRLRGLDLGPRVGLAGPLASARNRLADVLTRTVTSLERGIAAGQATAGLLSGHHRVLLLATNNAEMRAGSGMILELGLLQTDNGSVHLQTIQPVDQLPVPPGAVRPPADLAARWGWLHPAADWTELLSSPRFDLTAPTAAQMWVAAGQQPVDAVIAIDPVFLGAVVGVTGPISADGLTLSGGQIPQELLHTQYGRFASPTAQGERHQELGDVARAAFDRLDAGGWSLTKMGEALSQAGRGRHVIVWSAAGSAQAAWLSGGVAGALSPRSVMVNIQNRGRNKLDWFLASSSSISVTPRGRQSDVTVTVHLVNKTPDGEAAEVVGRGSGVEVNLEPGQHLAEGDYLGMVALTVPGTATSVTIDGTPSPPIDGADGPTRVIATQYIVARGTSAVVTFHFTLPGSAGLLRVEPSARAPVMDWTSGIVAWTSDSPHTLSW